MLKQYKYQFFWGVAVTVVFASVFAISTKHGGMRDVEEDVLLFWVSPAGSDTNPGTDDQPFATLKRAQQAVRIAIGEGAKGLIRVWVCEGLYTLDAPWTFRPEDGGSSDLEIVYQACPDETVTISGGASITEWQQEDNNMWSTYLEDVYLGKLFFRDLFADSKRLTRARWPNPEDGYLYLKDIKPANPLQTEQRVVVNGTIPAGNLAQQDAEAVFLQIWSSSRKLIRFSDQTSITTEFPIGYRGHGMCEPSIELNTRLFLENSPEFLDMPGQWYLDRDTGMLRLMLAESDNPDRMNIIAPQQHQLLIVKGAKERPVENLHFRGLRFRYANWQLPLAGYNGMQAGTHGMRYIADPGYMLPAAIYFEYAQRCSIKQSEVAHTGASGIALGAGSRDIEIVSCNIYDIGGNGIVVGWRPVDHDIPRRCFETGWADPTDAPLRNIISDNRIHRCGQVQFGCVGYAEKFAAETIVQHNLIYDLPYSGISSGFTWNDAPTTQRGSRIEYNHIHDVMKLMYDGAGIYTLGYQPKTVIRNNLIEDVHQGHGIYTDEGSSRILIENNIVNRAGVYGFQQHYGHSNIIRNNIFASSGKYALYLAREGAKPAFQFERNIVWMDRHKENDHPWYMGRPEDKGEVFRNGQDGNYFVMDRNLYWDIRDREVKFGDMSFAQWQKHRQQDKNSIVADPGFRSPEQGDFHVPVDSPAIQAIGFEPIDLRHAGPRPSVYGKKRLKSPHDHKKETRLK